MGLTGRDDGPPLQAPPRVEHRLDYLQRELGDRLDLDAPALLGERAAIAGLTRHGDRSCGGSTRFVRAVDGWCAVCLARAGDLDAVEAWIGIAPDHGDPWAAIERAVGSMPSAEVVERGQLVGIPVSSIGRGPVPSTDDGPIRVANDLASRPIDGALVVDLSSLWAGPLCSHLLQMAGAVVVKVESVHRPDGARLGPGAFFDLLHAGQQAVALDFTADDGRRSLDALLRSADIVIEGSRPRALRQLGITPQRIGARCWISITAYGRTPPWDTMVGFGDDVAVAAGLVARDEGGPLFCADAVADPLAGMTAALAAFDSLARGGRWLVDVSLHAAAAVAVDPMDHASWVAASDDAASKPRARAARGTAPALGAHTDDVLRELTGRVA
jgi:hypothetical protein